MLDVSSRASPQHVAPPNSDCLACRKVPGVVRIISNPFYLLLQVLHFSCFCSITLDFGRPRDKKPKGFKSQEKAGRTVGPPRPVLCSGHMFKNSRNAGRKCVEASSSMNHKCILVCRSTSCKTLEGRRQPQTDVVEERGVPEVCLLQCLHGHSR
jgi:hypothetical protein